MIRVNSGNKDIQLLECINPKKNIWRVRWDVRDTENGVSYMEQEFSYKPDIEEIRNIITVWYNVGIEKEIREGFIWNDISVWLSAENQFNYKVAYDLAVQSGGDTLPVTFKLGMTEEPVYHLFETLTELEDFYISAMKHIQKTLEMGWKTKDIEWEVYKV